MNLWSAMLSSLPFEWAHYGFMHNALLAAVIFTPLLAVLGCLVVNNRMAFFSDAIGHSALTGIAIGAILGLADPLWAMIGFSVLIALCITLLRKYWSGPGDTVIGIVMSAAIALGIVVLSRGGGFNRYSRYLIGDLLSITPGDIALLLAVAVAFIILWALVFNRFLLVSVNSALARSRKINVWGFQTVFAVMTALIVTVSLQWVGILVINALIILPAAAARPIAASTRSYIAIAAVVGLVSGVSGLIASYYWSTASGATIVLIATGLYGLSLVARLVFKKC